jgi:hypothetical protein
MDTGRRAFFKKTLGGAAIVAIAGAVPLALRRTQLREVAGGRKLAFFSPVEYSIFAALADRILAIAPAGEPTAGLPEKLQSSPTPAQVDVAGKADLFLAPLPPSDGKQLKQLIGLFDNALVSLLMGGPPTPFTQQTPEQQDQTLHAWATSRLALRRTGFQAIKRLCGAIYFGSPETYGSSSYPGPPDVSAVRAALSAAEKKAEEQPR